MGQAHAKINHLPALSSLGTARRWPRNQISWRSRQAVAGAVDPLPLDLVDVFATAMVAPLDGLGALVGLGYAFACATMT